MASAYSTLRKYNEFIPPVNLELMAKGMEVKQQKFEENYAAIQGQIDLLGNLDLIKAEDKQYVYDRTQKLVSQINSFSNITDLSNSGVAKQISSHIKQALDSNVMNALTSTANFRSFQTEVNKIKEKNPEKYSVINEMYSLRPYMDWINDGKAGTKMGTLSYVPKSDPQGRLNTILKDAMTSRGTYKFQERDPNNPFGLIEKEYSGLDETMITNIVSNMLTAEERQQLAIDGWYNLGGASDADAVKIRDNYVAQQDEAYKGSLLMLREDLNRTADPSKKQVIQAQIDNLESDYKNFSDMAKDSSSSIGNTTEKIGYFFEHQKLLNGLKSNFKRDIKSITVKADEAYKNKRDDFFRSEELKLNTEKFNLDVLKFQTERADKEAEKQALMDNNAVRVPGGGEDLTEINTYTSAIEKVGQDEKLVSSQIEDALRKQYTDSEEADKIIAALRDEADKSGTSVENLMLDRLTDRNVKGELGKQLWNIEGKKDKIYNTFKVTVDTDRKAAVAAYGEALADSYLEKAYKRKIFDSSDDTEKGYYKALLTALGKPVYGDVTTADAVDETLLSKIGFDDSRKENFSASLSGLVDIVGNDAWNIGAAHPKYNALYLLAANTSTGASFSKDLPIQVTKKGENVVLSQYTTNSKGESILKATAETGSSYADSILGSEFDITGTSMKKKTEYRDLNIKMQPYAHYGADPEVDDNITSYMQNIAGANSAEFTKLMYHDDVVNVIDSSLKTVNPEAARILTSMVNNADKFTISTKELKSTKDIAVSIKDRNGNTVGSTTINRATFDSMDKGTFFSAPQLLMSQIVNSYITTILSSGNPSSTPATLKSAELSLSN